jgi:formylglycine-generating enzyme required for sulfatase activity
MATPEPGRRPRGRPNLDQLYDSLQPSEPVAAKTVVNALGQTFAWLPAGSFRMGSDSDADGHRSNEGPVHEAVLTKPFYLSVQPVTQRVYTAVLKQNPSWFNAERDGSPDHPVERVSWTEAVQFCDLLSEHPDERAGGRTYRLPTEAEWEYACRGGTADAPTPTDVVHGTTASATVGPRPSNTFGLFDMLGNVWEWCADWYGERFYATAPLRDPAGPPTGTLRVCRGGSWKNLAGCCRAAYRNALAPHSKSSAVGFRVVVEVR